MFQPGGSVTAGNSSSLNDGASGVLMMSEKKAKELSINPDFVNVNGGAIALATRDPFASRVFMTP